MVVNKKNDYKEKGVVETLIDDTSLIEKLICIMWCGIPYMIWLIFGNLITLYRVSLSVGVWILLTFLCLQLGKFMGSDERDWN